MADTKIEWAEKVWQPTRGCTPISPGCKNCYAMRQAIRLAKKGQPYHGLVKSTKAGPQWTGQIAIGDTMAPLYWRKPRRIFVDSMSDLFHEGVSTVQRDYIFAVMACASWHTFIVLTKRARAMCEYLSRPTGANTIMERWGDMSRSIMRALEKDQIEEPVFPLRNVWLGVSVEDQRRADERLPWLLKTPARVRFASYEPALGAVDFRQRRAGSTIRYTVCPTCDGSMSVPVLGGGGSCPACFDSPRGQGGFPPLDWLIVGGESGPGARPCDVQWIRSAVEQCKAAGTAVFVKQLGAEPGFRLEDEEARGNMAPSFHHVVDGLHIKKLKDRKGGDPAEWPEDLRVRQYPE